MPLSEYGKRVKSAIHSLESLQHSPATLSESSISSTLRDVRDALPPKDLVEWKGTKFLVDNSWLDLEIKEIERSGTSSDGISAAVERSVDRLRAIESRLDEIEKASLTSLPSKAEMQGRLSSILQRPEYARKKKEEPAYARLINWILKWLNSLLPERRQISPERATTVSNFAQIIVIVMALAAIAYVLWMFAPRLFGPRRKKKTEKKKARIVLGERLEPDKSASDVLAEAEALARSGDLRGAIRRGYIALLIELADRKVISLAQYKTNRDYLRSVREIRKLYSNMEVLTNNFELHWYGLAPADENDWAAFRAGYKEAITST